MWSSLEEESKTQLLMYVSQHVPCSKAFPECLLQCMYGDVWFISWDTPAM